MRMLRYRIRSERMSARAAARQPPSGGGSWVWGMNEEVWQATVLMRESGAAAGSR